MNEPLHPRTNAPIYMRIILFLAAIALLTLLPAGRITAIEGYPATLPANPPTDQILVMFSDDTPAFSPATMARRIDRLSEAAGAELTLVRPLSGGGWVFRLPARLPERNVAAMARRLTALPEVAIAEPDRILTHTGDQNARPALPVTVSPRAANQTPDDPQFPDQWHYDFVPGVSEGLNLLPAWDITTGSSAIVVAVLDTGIRPHADLAGRVLPGYDFITPPDKANDGDHQSPENSRDPDPSDPGDWVEANGCGQPHQAMDSSWHGTHVAGTIGAASNNGTDVAGIDWQAQILPVRVLGRCGGTFSDVIDAIRWAAGLDVPLVPANPNPAQVINMSLGGPGTCSTNTFMQAAINDAAAAGVVVVVAAGNDGWLSDFYTPASCNNVITVAAANRAGSLAWYSNYGSSVEVAAPGGETYPTASDGILSTLNDGLTVPGDDILAFYQGTSMAAPHVSGVVSLMLSLNPDLTPEEVSDIIQTTARDFPESAECTPVRCGEGLVDAFAALSALDGNLDAPALVAPEDGATLTTSQPEVSWAAVTGADMYRVVIAGDDSFATNVIDMTVDSTEFTPADPLPDGTYYWRVKALNVGEASPWSDDWSFTVEQVPQCETPGAPDLLAPEDGHTFDVADQPLAFSWSAAENADVYSLAIDTDPDLSDAPVVTVGGLEHTLDAPLAPGDYFWAVTAASRIEGVCQVDGPPSETRSFSITDVGPAEFRLFLPATVR